MKTILVADDREVARELLESILTSSGYRVVLAADGREALDRAAECRADLVILDLHMPNISGFGVLEELRKRPEYRSVPVMALTASAMNGDRARALAAGFSEYVSKPVNVGALRREIARLLAEPGAASEKGAAGEGAAGKGAAA